LSQEFAHTDDQSNINMESRPQTDTETPSQREPGRVRTIDGRIPAREFLVYYFSSPDNVRCDSSGNPLNGQNEAGCLFPSFDDARAYASEKARGTRNVGAGVYDQRWKILAQFANEEGLRKEEKRRQPGRLLLWSTVFLSGGALLLWWEIRSGWTAIVGFLIGSRLLLSGILKLAEAVSAARKQRRTAKRIHA
jgi:hypothetical protein